MNATEPLKTFTVNWPRSMHRALKVAAAQRDRTMSEYLLICFRWAQEQGGLPPVADTGKKPQG